MRNTHINKLNWGHVAIGFLQRACWLVRYSVIIESNVTLGCSDDGEISSGNHTCGSLLICFWRREFGTGVIGMFWFFLKLNWISTHLYIFFFFFWKQIIKILYLGMINISIFIIFLKCSKISSYLYFKYSLEATGH